MDNKQLLYKKLNALRLEVNSDIVGDIEKTVDAIFDPPPPADPLVCRRCGTDKIEVKAWANPNTEQLVNFVEEPNDDETWCPVCEDHTGVALQSQKEDSNDTN